MNKEKLEKQAWLEASAIVANAMDHVDLPSTLSAEEKEYMRKFIRKTVAGMLRGLGL